MAPRIVCCVKQVLDPEAPASSFLVDEAARKVVDTAGVAPVISQFDQIAIEAALRIRDASGEGTITILSLGPESARDVIKTGLAMGADEGIHLTDPAFSDGDGYSTAVAIVAAIKRIGEVDLVICGRQAVDWDSGVTGLAIAELMGASSISITRMISLDDGIVRAQRILDDGFEVVEAPTPCVVTASNELGEPRYPKLPQIMAAARKEVKVWTASDLGLTPDQVGAAGARLTLESLRIPNLSSDCNFIDGENAEQMAANLANTLREAKLI